MSIKNYKERKLKGVKGLKTLINCINFITKPPLAMFRAIIEYLVYLYLFKDFIQDAVFNTAIMFFLFFICFFSVHIVLIFFSNLLSAKLEKEINEREHSKKIISKFNEETDDVSLIKDIEKLKETTAYKNLNESITQIKKPIIVRYAFKEVFGQQTKLYDLYESFKEVPSDIETYISRNHIDLVIELINIYPVIKNFEDLIKTLKTDRYAIPKDNTFLNEIENKYKNLGYKLVEIKRESDRRYKLEVDQEKDILFKVTVNNMIESKQFL